MEKLHQETLQHEEEEIAAKVAEHHTPIMPAKEQSSIKESPVAPKVPVIEPKPIVVQPIVSSKEEKVVDPVKAEIEKEFGESTFGKS